MACLGKGVASLRQGTDPIAHFERVMIFFKLTVADWGMETPRFIMRALKSGFAISTILSTAAIEPEQA